MNSENIPAKNTRSSLFRNWVSLVGVVVIIGAIFSFLLLTILNAISKNSNPYVSIITFIAVPALLVMGVALVFVERLRDGQILRGSGEDLNAGLRRLEIIEMHEADDEWQMVRTRHLYREETPRQPGIPFLSHRHLPALGGLRLATTPRNLGTIDLTH